jgi:hypothetical protein
MADDFDLRGRQGTYAAFTKLIVYAAGGILLTLALMGIFLV